MSEHTNFIEASFVNEHMMLLCLSFTLLLAVGEICGEDTTPTVEQKIAANEAKVQSLEKTVEMLLQQSI